MFCKSSTIAILAVAAVVLSESINIPRACTGGFSHLKFCNTSFSLDERIEDLLQRLTIEEKAEMLTARASPRGSVPSIGVPEYNWGANCVHGVQSKCGTNCATSFPNPINLGATFNQSLVRQMAQVIGIELRALWLEGAEEHVHKVHLGLDCWSPNININRDPRWGRNEETPSEDPYVNGMYAVDYTQGLQQGEDKRYYLGIVTLKHWAAYSLENYKQYHRESFNAIVNPYDMADTYFPAFKRAIVQGKAKGIMCSYNSVNGIPMCANRFLYHVIRDVWHFDGYSTSDTLALKFIYDQHNYTHTACEAGAISLLAGTDINSGPVFAKCLANQTKTHRLHESDVDVAIRRALRIRFELGLFDPIEDQPYWHYGPERVNTPASQQLNLEATEQSLVLLKNEHNLLPLPKSHALALVGPHIHARRALLGNYYGQPCKNGFSCVRTPMDTISALNHGTTQGAMGCSNVTCSSVEGLQQAVDIANKSDVIVFLAGLDSSRENENLDRLDLRFPGHQLELFQELEKLHKPIVAVILNGGGVGLEYLKASRWCFSIVEAFYPGVAGSTAIANLLFGHMNPSGKLPITLYASEYADQVAMTSMDMTKAPGRTYRYFTGDFVYPFGWGLSYTSFQLSSPTLDDTLGPNVIVTVMIKNTGHRTGQEVVFAYFRPLKLINFEQGTRALKLQKQLFGYEKVGPIAPNDSKSIDFAITSDCCTLVDDKGNRYRVPGEFELIFTNGVNETIHRRLTIDGNHPVIVEPFPHLEQIATIE